MTLLAVLLLGAGTVALTWYNLDRFITGQPMSFPLMIVAVLFAALALQLAFRKR